MKLRIVSALAAFGLAAVLAGAAESNVSSPIDGSWKWTFKMPDGGEISPRVKFKTDKEGVTTGTARFRPGTDTPVTNIVVKGDELSFDVVRGRDGRAVVTHYTGKIKGDKLKGKITSNWGGEEQSYDWSAERLISVDGTWKWSFGFGEGTVKLKQEGEKVTGKMSSRRGEVDIHKGKFKDGKVSFQTERERDGEKFISRYYGELLGDTISGKMEINFDGNVRTNDWNARRAE
jgi:hypothetical protein